MKVVNEKDYETLRKVVFSNKPLEQRLRAHTIVLFEKGFRLNQIENILEKSEEELSNLLFFIDFFGIEKYLETPYEELARSVYKEWFKREQFKARIKDKGFFYYLFYPVTSIFNVLRHIGGILSALLAWLIVILSHSHNPPKNSNIATFDKGASDNYLIQINKVVINDNNLEESEVTERFATTNKGQLQRKIEEIISSEENITFEDKTVDKLIEKGREKDSSGKLEISRVQLYAGLIVAYLLYSSSFKGGVWTISFFGMMILVTFRTCTPTTNNNLTSNNLQIDSISTQSPISIKKDHKQLDSIKNEIKADQPVVIYDYSTYFNIIEEFYERDHHCNALSAVGEKQKKFIYEYDKINHKSKNYFIDKYDQKYYVHVVTYSDIRKAAFQMHYLNSIGIFEAKILEVVKNRVILYTVVIGKYNGDQLKEICSIAEMWESYCFNKDVEIACIYNG